MCLTDHDAEAEEHLVELWSEWGEQAAQGNDQSAHDTCQDTKEDMPTSV